MHILIKRIISRPARYIRRHKRGLLVYASVMLLVTFFSAVFWPQRIAYAFDTRTVCTSSPRLLPGLLARPSTSAFTLERPADVRIGSLELYSSKVCVRPKELPKERLKHTTIEKFGFMQRVVHIETKRYPAVILDTSTRSVPPQGRMELRLHQPDDVFSYTLRQDKRVSRCKVTAKKLQCPLQPLQLAYASDYTLSLNRTFKTDSKAISKVKVRTLTPVGIVATSIEPNATVIQKPAEISLTTDKQLTSSGTTQLLHLQDSGEHIVIPTTTRIEGSTLRVQIGEVLPRKARFLLRVESLEAEDKSGLTSNKYELPFATSGGPRLQRASIGTRNVSPDGTITLTFDQPLSQTQDMNPLVTLSVNDRPYGFTLHKTESALRLTPHAPLPLCAPFTVKTTNDIQSIHGIGGDSGWSLRSRVTCHTTFSIGNSVQGRPITAYRFGTGPSPVVYIGALHGSEQNSKAVATAWFNELQAHPERLSSRSLVVIPAANPDGFARGTRFNSRNVDLNRNFPAHNWKSMVTTPQSSQPAPAGGPHPLSEPESSAIASYIRKVQPRLVVAFHSAAAVVEANEAGDSLSVATTYGAKARYRVIRTSQNSDVFQYDTTGALESWMHDVLGRPAIVVELASRSSSEFSRNRDALWFTAGL